MLVSPDAGGVERARAFAKRLNVDLAIMDKRRPKANMAEIMNVIGNVEGYDCVIVDDIIDTAGTLVKTVEALNRPRRAFGLRRRGASGALGSGDREDQCVRDREGHGDRYPDPVRGSGCVPEDRATVLGRSAR